MIENPELITATQDVAEASKYIILEIGIAVSLVAAFGWIATRFKLSVIPFFILLGMVLGPKAAGFVPETSVFRFPHSYEFIEFMGRLGVLFLLFYLGLEFSVGRLIRSGKNIVVGGGFYVALNFVSGLLMGWLMKLPFAETMVLCGIMTSSSTAIVAKVLTDLRRTANPETEIIMGMIMFDDLFIAMHISFLSGLVLTKSGSVWAVVGTCALALAFILVFLVLGRKVVPYIDRLLKVNSSEVFILIIFGLLFITAGFSEQIHVAEAIGALMAGLVLADSSYIKRIEQVVMPFKDYFGAMFFFWFGLSISIGDLSGAAMWAAVAALLTVMCNVGSGLFAAKFAGLKPKVSFDIGFTLAARGEFSIIMAGIGSQGNLDPVLQSFVAVYVLILSIVAPLLTKDSRTIWEKIFGKSGPTGPKKIAGQPYES